MSHRDAIAAARAIHIEDETARRGIRLRGQIECVGPCPRCGGTDRFAINIRKQIFNCRGCRRGGDVIALVQWLDGCGFREAIETLTGGPAAPAPSPLAALGARVRLCGQEDAAKAEEAQCSAEVLAIWTEAADPRGTPVETYLQRRGLTLPDDAADEAIRFHPRCKFGLARIPCMVALVRNVVTDEPRAIHRTAITAPARNLPLTALTG